jgi:hypothetical protein
MSLGKKSPLIITHPANNRLEFFCHLDEKHQVTFIMHFVKLDNDFTERHTFTEIHLLPNSEAEKLLPCGIFTSATEPSSMLCSWG